VGQTAEPEVPVPDLSVSYMGLKLRNPLIVAASSLTGTAAKLKRCEEAGAGAVVLKSLFEEQIEVQTAQLEKEGDYGHPEAADYLRQFGLRLNQDQYLKLVKDAKASLSIPVIASLNGVSPRGWTAYASKLAAAGADAIELNIALLASNYEHGAADIEGTYLKIVQSIRAQVKLPVAVKLGPYFTSLPQTAVALRRAGAAALVLFNRFYQLDFDIEKLALAPGYHLSSPDEIHQSLRWIALLSSEVGCDLSASTGVHDGAGVVKMLLAGAKTVQLCSTLFLKGMGRLQECLKDLEAWMQRHSFAAIEDFRGKMSQEASPDPQLYERLQYIKVYVGLE
jgi:dihydroorotate dehydrogenase (fumarate)